MKTKKTIEVLKCDLCQCEEAEQWDNLVGFKHKAGPEHIEHCRTDLTDVHVCRGCIETIQRLRNGNDEN